MRLDFNAGLSSYAGTTIAQANPAQDPPPFAFLSPIAAIDGATPANLYFYGERTPFLQEPNRRIYRSDEEITFPAFETPIASYPDVFSALELYVAASSSMKVVYRGALSGQTGIFKNDANLAVATPALGFPTTGTRPGINSLDTVAFYGIYDNVSPQLPGIFLRIEGELSPRFAGNLAARVSSAAILSPSGVVPSTYSSTDRVALNDYNQVAFIGNDSENHQSIFTTALGRTRKLVSVGDRIRSPINNAFVSITALALYNGLGRKGQVTFFANTDNDQLLVVANRAYNQRSTLYSPISPSYRGTQYLLRSVPGSGHEPEADTTIGHVGCNLTSTINLLNAYGATTSPLEFQEWLIDHSEDYITCDNDFTEAAVEAFSQHLVGQNRATEVIRFNGWHNRNTGGSNLDKIKSELRAGRPVKLRVPSSTRYGHYILAYGLIDPSKPDAQITTADILIADPGKNPDFTLADYGQIMSQNPGQTYDQVWGADWLEDQGAADNQRRVHLYDNVPVPNLNVAGCSPIQIMVTDSAGRRAGFTTATGTLREIPGSDYYEETSYQNLDEAGETPEPVWGTTDPVKHIRINGAVTGAFRLDILGTGTGSYTIFLLGNGGVSPEITTLSGTTTNGEVRTVSFNVGSIKPKFLDPLLNPDGGINWTIIGDPLKVISVETSTDLVGWTPFPSPMITNGIGTITVNSRSGASQQFLRAVSD